MTTDDIQIIGYNPLYKGDFVRLNEEWITHYFSIEDDDRALFANPEAVIQNGGNIFFALYEGKTTGTVALIKENNEKYEVSKMAVSPEYRGKGIGEKLLRHVIDYARKNNYKSLYLISNTALIPAITLYEKLGFKQVPLGDNHYRRGNYKAEIQVSRNSLFVIKIGGKVIDDKENLSSFLKQFADLFGKNAAPPFRGRGLLVHGGGKIATKIGEQLGIKSRYINGRRITDDDTIDLVTMVYGGLVNKKIVAQLQAQGCNAIGLTGADANIIPAKKRPVLSLSKGEGQGEAVDYGWVGDINTEELIINNLELIIKNGITPVFAPLTHDGQGHILNTNADTVASALSIVLSQYYDVRLIYCFEKKGVLENVNDENSVIRHINKEKYGQLLNEKKLFEGIIPKIDNAFAAIDVGVKEVLIGDAADLLKNTTDETAGTLITNE